jgi:2-polyprenyl-6-hydroxyphenyl methylase/3-demethylubiquinone-9 3-methyltransferase
VKQLTGMSYNPLSKIYSLVADTDINYIMHCRRND